MPRGKLTKRTKPTPRRRGDMLRNSCLSRKTGTIPYTGVKEKSGKRSEGGGMLQKERNDGDFVCRTLLEFRGSERN